MSQRIKGFRAFWPFYLSEHTHPINYRLHAVGSILALLVVAAALVVGPLWLLAVAAVCGYGFAWVGHFRFQRNRPATFRYPLKSFACDWALMVVVVTGRMRSTLERHGLQPGGDANPS